MTTATLVERFYEAYTNRQPIDKEAVPETLEMSEAYRVQQLHTDKKAIDDKDNHAGYKISLTSEETQRMFNSTTPLYGALTRSTISDGTIELSRMLSPLIELELVFIVEKDLSTEDDYESIMAKTRIVPGLEIPDSRFTNWFPNLSLGQLVADSAVAGKVVIGNSTAELSYDQLHNIEGALKFEGEVIASGISSEVLGNPVHAVKWLIDELAKHGQSLKKGAIISSGTFILPKVLKKGKYEASFKGVGNVILNVI
ncbi:hydratase [Filibacter tadaridae]|uniref:2-oxopent-4-enoate hydratase n=1 Tax=Filibacter tadaridae TaxID=2483811 RepID=A0A3P5XA00_9BACL|nr:hydratase [Filibacter tadaridae]VDC28092.1 2-oxopent-4-enoate hydratase [Filibacter tadaridae]